MTRNSGRMAVRVGGRSRARRLLVVSCALALLAAPSIQATGDPRSDVPVTVIESGGVYTVDAAFSVPQPAAIALAALTDYAQIPRFMPEVRRSDVLERSDEYTVVEQEAVARFMMFSRRVHLVLEVREAPGTIRFRDRCGKSFLRYDGVWTLAEEGGRTLVTYQLSAQPSFDVPGFLLKRLLKRDANDMIERLKAEIVARADR